jgi:hypothetical protein
MLRLPKARLASKGSDYFELILARDLGMTRAALRSRMSTAEFTDWLALYALEAEERKREAQKRR